MTRKDFVLLAAALQRATPNQTSPLFPGLNAQHRIDCRAIADALGMTNPRFDRSRFLKACGVEVL